MLSGETANTDTPYEFMDLHRGPSDAELDEALKPDTEKDEAAFKVVNNNFAFTPGQLGKQLNPKSPNAFVAMGGLRGLELGLRTDRERGLNPDEKTLEGSVSLREARYAPFGDAAPDVPRPALKDVSSDHSSGSLPGAISKHPNTERRWRKKKIVHEAPRENFIDRYRVFSDNTLPQRKKKTFLQLMWQQYNDKVLILLTGAAIISLALGLYETLGTGDHIDEATGKKMPKVNWIEGVAICIAIILVVFTGSGNDYQKERQFKKLHSKVCAPPNLCVAAHPNKDCKRIVILTAPRGDTERRPQRECHSWRKEARDQHLRHHGGRRPSHAAWRQDSRRRHSDPRR